MNYIRLSFLLLIAVMIFGAFGAHSLKEILTPVQMSAWHTAVEYQFYHGLGILLLSIIPEKHVRNSRRLMLAKQFLFVGVILFCGSIYLLSTESLTGTNISFLGLITPIGGLCFITGWSLALFSVKK